MAALQNGIKIFRSVPRSKLFRPYSIPIISTTHYENIGNRGTVYSSGGNCTGYRKHNSDFVRSTHDNASKTIVADPCPYEYYKIKTVDSAVHDTSVPSYHKSNMDTHQRQSKVSHVFNMPQISINELKLWELSVRNVFHVIMNTIKKIEELLTQTLLDGNQIGLRLNQTVKEMLDRDMLVHQGVYRTENHRQNETHKSNRNINCNGKEKMHHQAISLSCLYTSKLNSFTSRMMINLKQKKNNLTDISRNEGGEINNKSQHEVERSNCNKETQQGIKTTRILSNNFFSKLVQEKLNSPNNINEHVYKRQNVEPKRLSSNPYYKKINVSALLHTREPQYLNNDTLENGKQNSNYLSIGAIQKNECRLHKSHCSRKEHKERAVSRNEMDKPIPMTVVFDVPMHNVRLERRNYTNKKTGEETKHSCKISDKRMNHKMINKGSGTRIRKKACSLKTTSDCLRLLHMLKRNCRSGVKVDSNVREIEALIPLSRFLSTKTFDDTEAELLREVIDSGNAITDAYPSAELNTCDSSRKIINPDGEQPCIKPATAHIDCFNRSASSRTDKLNGTMLKSNIIKTEKINICKNKGSNEKQTDDTKRDTTEFIIENKMFLKNIKKKHSKYLDQLMEESNAVREQNAEFIKRLKTLIGDNKKAIDNVDTMDQRKNKYDNTESSLPHKSLTKCVKKYNVESKQTKTANRFDNLIFGTSKQTATTSFVDERNRESFNNASTNIAQDSIYNASQCNRLGTVVRLRPMSGFTNINERQCIGMSKSVDSLMLKSDPWTDVTDTLTNACNNVSDTNYPFESSSEMVTPIPLTCPLNQSEEINIINADERSKRDAERLYVNYNECRNTTEIVKLLKHPNIEKRLLDNMRKCSTEGLIQLFNMQSSTKSSHSISTNCINKYDKNNKHESISQNLHKQHMMMLLQNKKYLQRETCKTIESVKEKERKGKVNQFYDCNSGSTNKTDVDEKVHSSKFIDFLSFKPTLMGNKVECVIPLTRSKSDLQTDKDALRRKNWVLKLNLSEIDSNIIKANTNVYTKGTNFKVSVKSQPEPETIVKFKNSNFIEETPNSDEKLSKRETQQLENEKKVREMFLKHALNSKICNTNEEAKCKNHTEQKTGLFKNILYKDTNIPSSQHFPVFQNKVMAQLSNVRNKLFFTKRFRDERWQHLEQMPRINHWTKDNDTVNKTCDTKEKVKAEYNGAKFLSLNQIIDDKRTCFMSEDSPNIEIESDNSVESSLDGLRSDPKENYSNLALTNSTTMHKENKTYHQKSSKRYLSEKFNSPSIYEMKPEAKIQNLIGSLTHKSKADRTETTKDKTDRFMMILKNIYKDNCNSQLFDYIKGTYKKQLKLGKNLNQKDKLNLYDDIDKEKENNVDNAIRVKKSDTVTRINNVSNNKEPTLINENSSKDYRLSAQDGHNSQTTAYGLTMGTTKKLNHGNVNGVVDYSTKRHGSLYNCWKWKDKEDAAINCKLMHCGRQRRGDIQPIITVQCYWHDNITGHRRTTRDSSLPAFTLRNIRK